MKQSWVLKVAIFAVIALQIIFAHDEAMGVPGETCKCIKSPPHEHYVRG